MGFATVFPGGSILQRQRSSAVNPQDAAAVSGAAQESNLPSRGLHDLTDFEDRLGHPARPLQGRAES
jgi:hypothetical protein